jgi:hypothetical protein
LGKVPWERILDARSPEVFNYLSLRGKNLAFLTAVSSVLQLDTSRPLDWTEVKAACTPHAVREIYLALINIWPSQTDLSRVFETERSRASALYVGLYEPELVLRGITRHSTYADQILMFDPFNDPRTIRPEHNPVENPEKYVSQTLRDLWLWCQLAPWIVAGLVKIVRSPGDFDQQLRWNALLEQERRFAGSEELQRVLQATADEIVPEEAAALSEYVRISQPDQQIAREYLEEHPEATEENIQGLMRFVASRRREHPYYVPAAGGGWRQPSGEYHVRSSGENYAMARFTAGLTDAHLITDIASRWKEMELDRSAPDGTSNNWEPFAKAFQNVQLSFLNTVPLHAALRLRQDDRLSSMRSFLRKVWRTTNANEPFSPLNANLLRDELLHEMALADDEWRAINRELATWGAGAIGGAVASASQIAKGSVGWMAAGAAIAIGGRIGSAWHRRRQWLRRFPAGFFLQLKRQGT